MSFKLEVQMAHASDKNANSETLSSFLCMQHKALFTCEAVFPGRLTASPPAITGLEVFREVNHVRAGT